MKGIFKMEIIWMGVLLAIGWAVAPFVIMFALGVVAVIGAFIAKIFNL